MTTDEFKSWLNWHFARFSGAASWLAKFPTEAKFPVQPTQKDITNAWFGILKVCELQHAKTASQLLAKGEANFPERGFDCHPRTVRAIALQLGGKAKVERKRARAMDGRRTFDCMQCADTGLVAAWHPTALRFFEEHFIDDPPASWPDWFTDPRWQQVRRDGLAYEGCAFRCDCEAAAGMKIETPVFNPDVHFERGNGDLRIAIERLRKTFRKEKES